MIKKIVIQLDFIKELPNYRYVATLKINDKVIKLKYKLDKETIIKINEVGADELLKEMPSSILDEIFTSLGKQTLEKLADDITAQALRNIDVDNLAEEASKLKGCGTPDLDMIHDAITAEINELLSYYEYDGAVSKSNLTDMAKVIQQKFNGAYETIKSMTNNAFFIENFLKNLK